MCFTYVAATLVLGSLQDARVWARHVRSRTLPMLFGKYWYFTWVHGEVWKRSAFRRNKIQVGRVITNEVFHSVFKFFCPLYEKKSITIGDIVWGESQKDSVVWKRCLIWSIQSRPLVIFIGAKRKGAARRSFVGFILVGVNVVTHAQP